MPNDFNTSFAKTITQLMATELSSYSKSPDSLLGKIDVEDFIYGKQHISRPISDPYDDVTIDRRFAAPEQEAQKLMQDVDFACISKRLRIDNVDYNADPMNSANHVRDFMSIVKDGIEKFFIEGTSAKLTNYGLEDYPNTTPGSINRPEMCGYVSAAAADGWETPAHIRKQLIIATGSLIKKRFHGPHAILAPSIVRPMLTELISTGTPVSVNQWVSSTFGMPIIFSPFVHEGALDTDFNVYIVDLSKIHFGMSDLKVTAWYEQKDHAYLVDFEIFVSFLSDPLKYDDKSTDEWYKGVYKLDAREYTETT